MKLKLEFFGTLLQLWRRFDVIFSTRAVVLVHLLLCARAEEEKSTESSFGIRFHTAYFHQKTFHIMEKCWKTYKKLTKSHGVGTLPHKAWASMFPSLCQGWILFQLMSFGDIDRLNICLSFSQNSTKIIQKPVRTMKHLKKWHCHPSLLCAPFP